MRDRIAERQKRTVGDDRRKPWALLCGQDSARRPHRYSPEYLRPGACLASNPLRSRADIAALKDSNCGVRLTAFAVIAEVEQQHAIASSTGFSGPFQQLESRTIQAVNEDNDRHCVVARN